MKTGKKTTTEQRERMRTGKKTRTEQKERKRDGGRRTGDEGGIEDETRRKKKNSPFFDVKISPT